MLKPNYRIYCTLLDSFAWYKQSEDDNAFQEFIDKINRVKRPSSEAADKGSALNQLIDECISGAVSVPDSDKMLYEYKNRDEAVLNFEFKTSVVKQFASYFEGAKSQIYIEAPIETRYGYVELYGYIDEIMLDTCYDIKTTGSYTFPKFLSNFQHLIYPYCLIHNGINIKNFEYTITDFSNMYKEQYVFCPDRDEKLIQSACCELIDFLELNRHLITDKKIFGGEND